MDRTDDSHDGVCGMNQKGFILPNPYMIMGAAAVVVVAFGLGYWKGWSSGMENYYEFKSQVEAANEQIRIDTEKKLDELAELQRVTEANWRIALDTLRNRPIRVRNNCGTGEMPSIPTPTGRPDEAPAQLVISTGECETVANNAVFDAAQVLHLQAFIKQQHEVTK